MAVTAIDVADRDHVDFAACAVDLAALLFQFLANGLIAVDILSAGRRNLDKDQFADAIRVPVEEAPYSVDPLWNALGIVETVDPDHRKPSPGRAYQALFRLSGLARLPQLREVRKIDTDRISAGSGCTPLEGHGAAYPVDLRPQFILAIMQEALEPLFGLEADYVIVEQRAHQSLVIGQRNKQARCRPRYMQEETDAVLKAP